jgi:3'(2'), 5'-bisphosphate nucleotidase
MSANGVLLPKVLEIARAAGDEILAIYDTDFEVEAKQDQSPLTAADLASHDAILAGLAALTPHWPVLSEESAAVPAAQRLSWDRFWLVDPLDGTREFVKRNGEFTVNIALIEAGVPVLGVVYVPVTGVAYYGADGIGAFKRIGRSEAVPIQVSDRAEVPVRVVGSRSHRGSSLDALLARLDAFEMLAMGSSLKLCLVAEGAADLYPRLGPTSEWDTAAADAVVRAAGGQVVQLDGTALVYNKPDTLLNPEFLVYGDLSVDWLGLLGGRP